MTIAEQKKLTAEMEQQFQQQTIPEWTEIEELTEIKIDVPKMHAEDRARKLSFLKSVELYKQLDAEIEEREKLKKILKEQLQAAMIVSGKDKVRCGDYMPTMVNKAGTKKIVPELLLAQGVDAMVIAKATEVGKSSTYLMINPIKDKDK